ncbi:hypothetical protein ScPMuIL_005269 [Solemya velum]
MAAEDFHVRLCLQEIVKFDLEAKALIQDIRECSESMELLEELAARTREKLSQLKGKIEDLEKLGKEQDRLDDRDAIWKDVGNHRTRLSNTWISLRNASLAAQLAIDKQKKEELLFGGSAVRKRATRNKETLVNSASNITESLMSLNRTMSDQVQRSGVTMSTLVTSSHQIQDTHEEFKNMGGHIQSSRKLLTKYGRRQFTDKLLIFLALVFFFSCVLYIMKKRLW